MTRKAEPATLDWQQLCGLVGFAADWVWEQDADFRFTRLAGNCAEGDTSGLVGKTRWEAGLTPVNSDGDWTPHQEQLKAGEPFRDTLMSLRTADDSKRFIRVSGRPCFDPENRFTGYQGIGLDVTDSQRAQEELHWFRAAIDASHDCITITDVENHRLLYANQTVCDLSGYSREEYLRLRPHQITRQTPEEAARVYEKVIAAGAAGMTAEPQILADREGKRKAWWEFHRRAVKVDGHWLINTISSDVTRRVLAEQAAQRSARMYATLSASNEVIVQAQTADEVFQQICDAAVDSGGFVNASIFLMGPGSTRAELAATAGAGQQEMRKMTISMNSTASQGDGLVEEAYLRAQPCVSDDFNDDPRTGAWRDIAAQANIKAGAAIPVLRGNHPVGVLLLFASDKRAFDEETLDLLQRITQNITFALQNIDHEAEREQIEERIRYLATHDGLTGLPNRTLFSELLNATIHSSERHRRRFAVMFIDLDHFKIVNDSLGHAAGDQLLTTISARLGRSLRSSDVLARMGGDEFVVLLQELYDPELAGNVARRMLDSVSKPITISKQECQVSASIGISCYPEDGEDEITLMKNADTAMYLAKEQGKNTFHFHSRE